MDPIRTSGQIAADPACGSVSVRTVPHAKGHGVTHRLLPLLAIVGLLAACGGDDDTTPATGSTVEATTSGEDTATTEPDTEPAPETTPETAPDTADDTSEGASGTTSDDETIVVDSLDDIPEECLDLMGAFLKEIEPVVSEVDWENATMNDLQALGEQFEERGSQLDDDIAAAGCERYDLGADEDLSLELITELAEREAPGTVSWLTFLYELTSIDDTTGEVASDVPTDCEGAIGYLEELVATYDSFQEVPFSEAMNVTAAIGSVQSNCTLERAQEFFSSPELTEFLQS